MREGVPQITDLNSKNGTFINGQRAASAVFRLGDVVHLSAARMVILEAGSGDHGEMLADGDPGLTNEHNAWEETQAYSGRASTEEMVSLLVTTASAVRRGAVADPLNWAVERFGLDAAAVLYRGPDDSVAMVSSAGDLGGLVRHSELLARLTREQKGREPGNRIQELSENDESLLVAPMQRDHVLVVRFSGASPAVGDIRAVIAAVEAVVCSGNPPQPVGVMPGDRRDPELRRFGSPLHRIAGLSHGINECKRQASEFALLDGPILVTGEPGTGKSLFARVIHDLSKRADGDFVTVEWDTVNTQESEARLLGRATAEGVTGALLQAQNGTLFLRDLARIPLELQARLLDLIEEGKGSPKTGPLVRLIAMSSLSCAAALADGAVHESLFSAFGACRLELPPLREHCEDIPLLVTHFQRETGRRGGRAGSGFTVDALEAMASYAWPENVRELRAEVLRLTTRSTSDMVVEVSDLSPHIIESLAAETAPPPDLGAMVHKPLADARAEFERWMILRALADSGWNQSQAAERLGLSRAGLFKKMRRLGLSGRREE
jgi:DNA-binding NtrC family response regulator